MPFPLPETRWALTLRSLARPQHALRHATISPLPVSPCPLKGTLPPCGVKASSPTHGDFAALRRQSLGEPSAVSFCCTVCRLGLPDLRLATYSARPLAGILPCGARTFLHELALTAAAWRTSRTHCTRRADEQKAGAGATAIPRSRVRPGAWRDTTTHRPSPEKYPPSRPVRVAAPGTSGNRSSATQ